MCGQFLLFLSWAYVLHSLARSRALICTACPLSAFSLSKISASDPRIFLYENEKGKKNTKPQSLLLKGKLSKPQPIKNFPAVPTPLSQDELRRQQTPSGSWGACGVPLAAGLGQRLEARGPLRVSRLASRGPREA